MSLSPTPTLSTGSVQGQQTERISATAGGEDDDPYSDFVPRAPTDDVPLTCFGERVLYEASCCKQSKWLRQWRRRWLVLTNTRLMSFRSVGGYQSGEVATETFPLSTMHVGAVNICLLYTSPSPRD